MALLKHRDEAVYLAYREPGSVEVRFAQQLRDQFMVDGHIAIDPLPGLRRI